MVATQLFFMFTSIWWRWTHFEKIFFKWVGSTNQPAMPCHPPWLRWRFAATPRDVFPRLATNRVGVSWHSELGGEKPWEYLGDIERNTVTCGIFWQMYLGDSSFFKRIFHVSFLGVYVSQLVDGCLKSRLFSPKRRLFFLPPAKNTELACNIYTHCLNVSISVTYWHVVIEMRWI